MKRVIGLLGIVLATGSISQAQEQGKISFFECRPSITQKLRLSIGADKKELMNVMIGQGQCSLATDLGFEYAAQALHDSISKGENLISVDQLPSEYQRNYCDGEDMACMKAEEVNRAGEADVTELILNPVQFQTISTFAADGIAKKHTKKSIYFIADETNKHENYGEGYDGKTTYLDLANSVLLIK